MIEARRVKSTPVNRQTPGWGKGPPPKRPGPVWGRMAGPSENIRRTVTQVESCHDARIFLRTVMIASWLYFCLRGFVGNAL